MLAVSLLAASAVASAFEAPIDISLSPGNSFSPSVAVERRGPTPGALRVFWHDFSTSPVTLGCVVNDGTGYGPPGACALTPDPMRTPRAATDSIGRTHLVWSDTDAVGQREIYYALWDRTAWSAPVNLSNSSGRSANPALAIDPADHPHVLWEDDTTNGTVGFWEAHFDGAAWSAGADTGIPFVGGGSLSDVIRIACDSTGTLHAVWHDGATSLTDVYHAERPPAGGWSPPDPVSATPDELSAEPSIAVGPGDVLHAVWVEQDALVATSFEVVYATRPPGGAWSPFLTVATQRANAIRPVVLAGADGVAQVAWTLQASDYQVYYVPWIGAPAENVSQFPGGISQGVSMDLDATGQPYLAWEQLVAGNREIYATTTAITLWMVADHATGEARLTWSGRATEFHVERSAGTPAAPPVELTPPGGTPGTVWNDPVLGDGSSYYYRVH